MVREDFNSKGQTKQIGGVTKIPWDMSFFNKN